MLEEGKDYRFDNSVLEIKDEDTWKAITIPGYYQKKVLAPGANGITVLAHHEILNREVVIKVWKPQTDNIEEYVLRFKAEIQKNGMFSSPYIAQVHDGNILPNGFCYSVMEYVKGHSLKEWLENHATSCFIFKKNVFINVIRAILTYQIQGIVHGDLHAGNIMIDNDSNAHIIDFGTSYLSDREYGKQRELFLEYQSLASFFNKKTAFNENHFIFSVDKKNRCLRIKPEFDCITQLEPYLLTQSLLAYSAIIGVLSKKSITNTERIKLLGFAIANSSYLNISEIVKDIISSNILNNNNFLYILREHIETAVFAEYPYSDEMFYTFEVSGIFSLQAALKWHRNKRIPLCKESEVEGVVFDKKFLSEITDIINDSNIDAIDIYKKHNEAVRSVREVLMLSIINNSTNQLETAYYLNSWIRTTLIDYSFKEKYQKQIRTISLNTINSYFDAVQEELFESCHEFNI